MAGQAPGCSKKEGGPARYTGTPSSLARFSLQRGQQRSPTGMVGLHTSWQQWKGRRNHEASWPAWWNLERCPGRYPCRIWDTGAAESCLHAVGTRALGNAHVLICQGLCGSVGIYKLPSRSKAGSSAHPCCSGWLYELELLPWALGGVGRRQPSS